MKYKTKKVFSKPLQLPLIEKSRNNDDDFMIDLVEAANELRESLLLCSTLSAQIDISQIYQAVLMGLVVRLYKLYDTYVLLINENRLEIALLLGRSACDSAIDLTYLCDKLDDNKLNKFIKASLATGRIIYDEIEEDKRKGNGNTFIQERIQYSILNSFKDTGFSMEEVLPKDKYCFGTVASRAEKCNLKRTYDFVYRNLSRVTHGNWSEFERYHLKKKDNLYYPNCNYCRSKPQSIDGISILICKAILKYTNTIAPGSELSNRLPIICDWFLSMALKHEQFLSDNK